jgi:predicted outer membrane protein
MKRLVAWTTAIAAALFVTLTLTAQERRDPVKNKVQDTIKKETTREAPTQTGRDQGRDQARGQGDTQLATWLAVDNEGEIEIGKFAAQRAQSDEVKKFAQQMVDHHTDFLKKLQHMVPIASKGAATAPGKAAQDQKRTTRPEDTTKRTETAQTRPGEDTTIRRGYLDPDGRIDLARLKQEIGQNCVQTLKKELGEKSSDEFDKCYLGQQILAHLEMADTLKVMKNFASPELRDLIADGEKTTLQHLDEAKDIMKHLAGPSGRKEK